MNALLYGLMLLMMGLAVGLLVMGLGMAWEAAAGPRQQRLSERWRGVSEEADPADVGRLIRKRYLSRNALLDDWLQRMPAMQAWDRWLAQTGVGLTLAQALGAVLVSALACGVFAWLLGVPLLWAVACVPMVGLLLVAYGQRLKTRRLAWMDQQLPDALDLMARALQAGHALSGALLMAAKESRPPIAGELQAVFDEINFGISVQSALPRLAERTESDSVRYFVVAALIQNETGGNLAEILKSTAALIRERQKMANAVRVLSAEGRLSAVILSVLPFAIAGFLSWVNPQFIAKLWTDPLGLKLLVSSLVLSLVGVVWMRRLVAVQV